MTLMKTEAGSIFSKTEVACFTSPLTVAGGVLTDWRLAYETYGSLNAAGDNAILICHALTADAHAAGRHSPEDEKPGWWDSMIGADKPFDTNRFFVVCSNVIGGCGGSTGPSSINPSDRRPYGLRFPVLTVADMVHVQSLLADRLGITCFHTVAGGCMGGFQVLEWMAMFPNRLKNAVVIGATPRASCYTIALWHVMREAIKLDPDFQNGDYYGTGRAPLAGVNLGTKFGMLVRMSFDAMEKKFGRRIIHGGQPGYTFEPEFEVENFLERIGGSGADRFDANSILYLTRAMDYFDMTYGPVSLSSVLRGFRGSTLLISYKSDWRYPPEQADEIRTALQENGALCEYRILESNFGHGAFIYDNEGTGEAIRSFFS